MCNRTMQHLLGRRDQEGGVAFVLMRTGLVRGKLNLILSSWVTQISCSVPSTRSLITRRCWRRRGRVVVGLTSRMAVRKEWALA